MDHNKDNKENEVNPVETNEELTNEIARLKEENEKLMIENAVLKMQNSLCKCKNSNTVTDEEETNFDMNFDDNFNIKEIDDFLFEENLNEDIEKILTSL